MDGTRWLTLPMSVLPTHLGPAALGGRVPAKLPGVGHVVLQQGPVVDHVGVDRIDPLDVDLAPGGDGGAGEAGRHPLLEGLEGVDRGRTHVPLGRGGGRHHVGLGSAVGEDAVDALVVADVLAQGGHRVVAQHGRVQGVAAHLRGGGGVGGGAGVAGPEALDSDGVEGAQLVVGRVDHHGRAHAGESAPADHDLLAAAPLLGRGPHQRQGAPYGGRHRGCGQPGPQPGRGDDVVAAGVADVGQGVVLAQHRHRGPVAYPGVESGVEPVGAPLDR